MKTTFENNAYFTSKYDVCLSLTGHWNDTLYLENVPFSSNIFSFQQSIVSNVLHHVPPLQIGTVTFRVGIGSLLDDSKYLNNVTETMPLSQQLSGLLEKSVSVKASQPKCTIYFFLVANFFILLLSYL